MILAIDIGNTNIVIGAYEGKTLKFDTRVSTDRSLEAAQYAIELKGLLKLYDVTASAITGAIISSVVPQVTNKVAQAVHMVSGFEPLIFSQALKLDMDIKIDNPAELGADLLAGAFAAKCGYKLPAVVVDMGTATKITAVDKDGAVLGVSIMPGVILSFNALINTASLLGGIAMDAPTHAIGTNTRDSIQSGVVLGAAGMLDGLLTRFENEMGGVASIISTGGAASFITPHCEHEIENVPTLILDGLAEAYYKVNK